MPWLGSFGSEEHAFLVPSTTVRSETKARTAVVLSCLTSGGPNHAVVDGNRMNMMSLLNSRSQSTELATMRAEQPITHSSG